ncbi:MULTISPECIES: hypothetical protein [unclassified Marinovum]
MPDDTTAALQALMQQVQTLTTTVTDQAKRLDDLHTFNSRVLDEKKDVQRQLDAQTPKKKTLVDIIDEEIHQRKMHAAGLEQDANGNWYPKGVRPPHSLTREEARDPAKYRAAKEAAEQAGTTLTVISGDGDVTTRNTSRPTVTPSKTFTFDDTHERVRYVRADMQTGNGIVNRRMQADKEGYTIKTFHSPDELPAHARTKFDLMERAANAESS